MLYTLFIVEIKTGKMPNNIGPTVNNMLKDIVRLSPTGVEAVYSLQIKDYNEELSDTDVRPMA